MAKFATLRDLVGPALEPLVADVLADAAEVPGTPYLDPAALAGFVRALGGEAAENAAAALCYGPFRARWAEAAAPHLRSFRVPLLAAKLLEENRGWPGTRRAYYADALALAEKGAPLSGYRVPYADGTFPGPRPEWMLRKFSLRAFQKAAGEGTAADFRDDLALAERVLSDPAFEAWALRRSLLDRCWPFKKEEHESLRTLAERKSVLIVLDRWFSEAGMPGSGRLAEGVRSKLGGRFGQWFEMAVHWVDGTEEGKSVSAGFVAGNTTPFSQGFTDSGYSIPRVKALLWRLARADGDNERAMAEFYRDAGKERSDLMRERAGEAEALERQAFASRFGAPPSGPRARR